MSVFPFIIVSTLEWAALILLSFTMFKIEIRGNRGQIALSSFLLSLLSHVWVNLLDLVTFVTFLQPPIVFVIYWRLFRIPFIYAILILTNGYLAYLLLTAIVFETALLIDSPILPGTPAAYLCQGTIAALAMAAAWLIYKYRLGYTFVHCGERVNMPLTKINLLLILVTFLGYIVVACFNFVYFSDNYNHFAIIPVVISLALQQYVVFVKEYTDYKERSFRRRSPFS